MTPRRLVLFVFFYLVSLVDILVGTFDGFSRDSVVWYLLASLAETVVLAICVWLIEWWNRRRGPRYLGG